MRRRSVRFGGCRFPRRRSRASSSSPGRPLPLRRRLRLEPLESRRLLNAARLYVDADSPAADPDGTAWSAAYVDLQAALDQAATLNADLDDTNDIDAIWIADGLYTPTKDKHNNATPDDPRTATFSMQSGVSLYGGFAGNEETLDDRAKTPEDTWLNETILTGDLDHDDNPDDETTSDDNAYTVVYAFELPDSVTLNALTVTAGNANGVYNPSNPEWRYGGGIYSAEGALTVANSTLTGNSADSVGGGIYSDNYLHYNALTVTNSTLTGNSAGSGGGGIYKLNGTLTVTNSTIAGNSSDHYGGGGISGGTGTLTVTNSTITGNSADGGYGGGIRKSRGTLTVINSTLTGNSADFLGGGIYSDGTVMVTNSTLTGNSANSGGGIYSVYGTLTVANSAIAENSAVYGGGIRKNVGTLTVSNSTLTENSALKGGGIYSRSGTLTVTNSTLTGNSADNYGGGIYSRSGTLTVTNSTIAGNSAKMDGGGIYSYSGPLTITNSIVYLNSGDDIRGSFDFDGSNNLLGVDPGFVRSPSAGTDGVWGTDDDDPGDLHLTDKSAAINLGDNLLAVDADGNPLITDVAGNPRIADDAVDVGAYEYQGPPAPGRETPSVVVSAAHDAFDLYDGDITLREAIYYCQRGIGDGTVTFDATLDGATITLAGSELVIHDSVLIDASALSSLTVDADGRSRVLRVMRNATFRGLTITGGLAGTGGGIHNDGVSLTVINCTLEGNSADGSGGGIFSSRGTLTVTNSTIAGNSADNDGGGIYSSGSLTLTNSIVCLNSADDIQGSFDGSNNLLGIDPGFVRSPLAGADGVWGTDDDDPGDLRLTDRSAAINLGDNLLAVDADGNPLATDLAGNPRIADDTVDIGAYEYQGPPAAGRETPSLVVSVMHDTFDLYDGDITLREAIYYCQSGIGDGTVTFDATLDGATNTLAGSELVIHDSVLIDASALSSLTVDADGRSRVFHVISDATLRGLTIIGGLANNGGGIRTYGGTLTVSNSTLVGNSAAYGGGISSLGGTLTVTNSTIMGNSADDDGGGISSSGGTLTVTNSTITRNSARSAGGGIRISGERYGDNYLMVTNSTIAGNSAGSDGGGICSDIDLTVTNSTIVGNSADGSGGGIYGYDVILMVTDSTIAGNLANNRGGGIYALADRLTLHNTIVAGNGAGGGSPDVRGSVTDTSSYNLIGDGSGMSGMADGENGNLVGTAATVIDPRFVREPSDGGDGWGDDPGTPDIDEGANDDYGDLRLLAESPAIDAGDNALVPEGVLVDLDGNPRIWNGTVDMGAYEYLDTALLHPGDANFDGVTDLSDFNIWNASKFTTNTAWATGDFNGDGLTDLSDFNIWNANKFTSAAEPAPIDAAHRQTATMIPTDVDFLADGLTWLRELDQADADPNKARPAAVDLLLASYWQSDN